MKIFEIRKSNSNATIPLKKISEVIETANSGYTLILDSGTQTTIDGTTKIIDITWTTVNNKWTKVEKRIKYEDFYEWYQSNIAEEN